MPVIDDPVGDGQSLAHRFPHPLRLSSGVDSFGVVVSPPAGRRRPEPAGSKNVGFTNVLRVSGKENRYPDLIGDIGKAGWQGGWPRCSCTKRAAV